MLVGGSGAAASIDFLTCRGSKSKAAMTLPRGLCRVSRSGLGAASVVVSGV